MNPMVVFLHGIGGSSKDWTEKSDYTNGHILLEQVKKAGYLYRCFDLYGHGDWKADEPDFDPEYINDEQWPIFIRESESVILRQIQEEIEKHQVDSLIIVSYSGSAIISLRIANRMDEHVRCMCIMAAPDPAREYDDEYSLHNQVNKRPMDYLLIYGENDEEINIDDLQWVFKRINGQKKMVELNGDHSIDQSWTEVAFQEIVSFSEA